MKKLAKILTQISLGLVMFLFGGFTSRWSDKVLNIEPDEELESDFIGKTATVVERVTSGSGKVRFMGADWRAEVSDQCTAQSIEPGEKVTIEKTEGNVLFVY